jgi:3-hydroxyisobutyrate dehydrogenase-like beta-hydroxyacid dehydrogenase
MRIVPSFRDYAGDMQLGFVGIGKMGAGIARNLLRAGHSVTVYNRTPEKSEALKQDGATVARSPAEAARDKDAVMTMLSDDHAVEEVVFGETGIASALKPGAVHVSHSTISVALAKKLADQHEKRAQGYLSAPVFGRPEAAEAKKLIVVAAGPAQLTEKFRSVFDAVGRRTFVLGADPSEANVVKLCGNFMIASMMEAFGEAFVTTEKSGVKRQDFLDVISELFGSPVYSNYGTAIANKKFAPAGFALKLGFKDIRLVLEAAQDKAVPMPLASLLRDQFLSSMAHGQQDLDWSSVSQASARAAGL